MKNDFLTLIMTRRSIRAYKPDAVPADVLARVLEAGTYAPSAMGAQSAMIVAAVSAEARARLTELNAAVIGKDTDPYYGAPVIVVVLGDGGSANYLADGSCVLENLMLARDLRQSGRQGAAARLGSAGDAARRRRDRARLRRRSRARGRPAQGGLHPLRLNKARKKPVFPTWERPAFAAFFACYGTMRVPLSPRMAAGACASEAMTARRRQPLRTNCTAAATFGCIEPAPNCPSRR